MSTYAAALTAGLALLGLGLVCAIITTALVDLWQHTTATRNEVGISLPFRRALIVAALVLVAAVFGWAVVVILSTVVA